MIILSIFFILLQIISDDRVSADPCAHIGRAMHIQEPEKCQEKP